MRTSAAIRYFQTEPSLNGEIRSRKESRERIAELLGITTGAVYQWGVLIPSKRAMQLSVLTNDELEFVPALYAAIDPAE